MTPTIRAKSVLFLTHFFDSLSAGNRHTRVESVVAN